METIAKRLIRDEKGAALILAMIVLLVGGVIAASLLAHMGSGLLAGEVYETRTAELYAADAGVEDAIWKIQHRVPEVNSLTVCNQSTDYTITTVNGKTVGVTITLMTIVDNVPADYRIISTATSDGDGVAAISSTTVEAYIETTAFDLFAGALVSSAGVTFHKGCTVTGDVYYVTEIEGDYTHTDGEEIQVSADAFPNEEENAAFFQQFEEDALDGGTYNENGGNMDIGESQYLGPIYIPGNLDISQDVAINLTGVVYVGGYIDAKNTLTITGSGSLVAEGTINLEKLANYNVTGDSVIMSLYGDIVIKKSDPEGELSIGAFIYAPNGTIFFDKDMSVVGSVLGAGIQIDKEGSFNYVAKASSFGFPFVVVSATEIETYNISQS